MIKKKVCVVIPAAGRGSRLGEDLPKILLPIVKKKTVWHILYEKLQPIVDQIHVVLSPRGALLFEKQLEEDGIFFVSFSIQKIPIGMGDAIFGAFDYWKDYENILVVWGDQVFVSPGTLKKTIKAQFSLKGAGLTIPITSVKQPYVEYIFRDNFSILTEVKQTREGDACRKDGFADAGVFCLSTVGLIEAWQNFLKNVPKGNQTGETNFLPFLPYLSTEMRWSLKTVRVKDSLEARGINTQQDMDFFKKNLNRCFYRKR